MTIHIEDQGQGEPVVLAHAGVTDRRVWDAAVPVLVAAGYRVIRYDQPGFGRSPRPTGPHSMVADALEVLDATGVESAHWVGLSQGGAIGVDVALAHPGRIRSLALVAPGMSGYDWPDLAGRDDRVAAWERGDGAGLALEILRLWGPMSFDAAGRLREDDAAAATVLDQADWFMQDEEEVEEPAAEHRLGEIAVPTLIVLGDRDVEPVADIGRRYERGIPGAHLVTLSPADHLLPLRVPDELHPLLLKHLG
ncbi:alpha/beta fold hydrolase [Amorphoplanes digitatis]|uniref:Pimeloyl-ACP methyl ester carboxylesterase n=1 Tax=Actinoplanes digitatis TaxID=1868 RepID=A0A7W7MS07_9ACTN|nr:alpha/beta fold hydrolase [Actinoplanes digitatis]MBB4764242.1 pimeloyl-ACP methyl ester carboxylesterase [Actinoplanes digitatis]GID96365.1 alpha/beta hydrolase [Actinoplanes digitatis]